MKTVRQFETNRRQNPFCPCGKSNRDGKFSPEKGFAGLNVGHCHSCGKDFWDEEGTMFNKEGTMFKEMEIPVLCTPEMDDVKNHFDTELKSGFARFLIEKFGEEKASETIVKYYLGEYDGDVIFWQMDRDINLRSGKVMSYNDKGKRQGLPKWWHKINGCKCQLNQYFFGGHLIDKSDKPIAIVESEKTACIMSIVIPNFIWLATGGLTQLQDNKCHTISEFDVTLFPDAGCYDQWNEVADKFIFEISRDCEIWLENGLISKGDDIADYYLKMPYKAEVKSEKIDPEWDQEEYDSIFNRPDNYRSDIYTGRRPK